MTTLSSGSHALLLGLLVALVAMVVGPFVVAAVVVARARAGFARELEAIETVRTAAVNAEPGWPQKRATILTAVEPPHIGTAVAERVRMLAAGSTSGVLPSRDGLALLSEVMTERRLRFPRMIANLLVLMGLAGTLLGLTIAVVSLGAMPSAEPVASYVDAATDSLSSGGPRTAVDGSGEEIVVKARERLSNVENSLRGTLVGMRTAFVPALLAVVCTIVLLLRLGRAQSDQRDVLAGLESLTDELLIPAFDPSPERLVYSGTADAVEAARGLLSSADQAARAIRESTESVGTAVQAASTDASRTLSEAITSAVSHLASAGAGLRSDTRAAASAILRVVEKAAERMAAAAEADREPLRNTIAQTGPVIAELELRTSRLLSVLECVEGAVDRLDTALGHETDVLGVVEGARRVVTDSLDRLAERSKIEVTAYQHLAESNGRLSAVLGDVERVRKALPSISTAVVGILEALHEQAALTRQLNESVAELGRNAAFGGAQEVLPRAEVRAVPEIVRVEVMDPRRHLEELRDMIVTLVEEQRALDDDRWVRILEERERQWSEQQAEAQRPPFPLNDGAQPAADGGRRLGRRWFRRDGKADSKDGDTAE